MANQRPKALFFIFLLLSGHAVRIPQSPTGDADASLIALNATEGQYPGAYGVAGYGARGGYGGYGGYGGFAPGGGRGSASRAMQSLQNGYNAHQLEFCSRCCSGRYSYTNGLTTSAYQQPVVTVTETGAFAGSSTTQVNQHVVSELFTGVDGKMVASDPGFEALGGELSAAISPYWPALIAAGVVLMGGLYLYHRHRMNGPVPATFCPVSSWEADPVGMLVGPAAHDAFGEQFTALLTEDNNRGMPRCHGLRRHRLRSDCDGDVDCKRQACRQMCCDRRDCTFYQFNTIDSTDHCWLGSRSRLSTDTCEAPFFGEICTTCRDRQVELWPQIHEDNMKCHSAFVGFTGFHVENQHECQAHAVEQGHPFYQYDSERHKCESAETCDSPSSHTIHNWRIFSSDSMPPVQPEAVRPPPDQEEWEFEAFLLHENSDMTEVQLAHAERCSAGDTSCMRDACRAQCLQHDWCIHYQFENGGHSCMLGATHVVDEDSVGMWFGGVLAQNRLCAADEYKCPSSHNCVSACGECDGHSREGPDGWCVRSAVENIVAPDHWMDSYQASGAAHPIDAWCRGIERSVVTVSQGLAVGTTGAEICRASCSADSQCAMYQMYPGDAAQSDLSEGDHVRCWLGMEDQLGRPRFSCTGRSPKRWRLLAAPHSEAVGARGCQDGKVACVFSQRCVDSCSNECPGFDVTDAHAGVCQPPPNPAMITDGVPMSMAIPQNLPDVIPQPEYALVADETDLFTMSLNVNNMINPDTFDGDTTAVCGVIPDAECDLIDGACVCEYDEDVNCDALFPSADSVSPVMAEEGMMLLSHERCSCEGRTCTLSLLNSVPPVRTHPEATSAIQLRSNENQLCEPLVCPNMNTCDPISYGASGCGYNCNNDEGRFWCSDRCACNKEEAVIECPANVMCPNMHSCNPISYGEYGCGYGCMRDDTFFFCNDACTNCNQ